MALVLQGYLAGAPATGGAPGDAGTPGGGVRGSGPTTVDGEVDTGALDPPHPISMHMLSNINTVISLISISPDCR